MDNQNNQEMQIDVNANLEDGVYSNMAVITHSSAEFILDFLRILPGKPKPKVASRVVMSPEHAKRLLMALRDNVAKYEETFGQIDLHTNVSRTIAPFKVPKGEA
ncbi:MAG: DUF3467 domain-containing protein [Bacteroidaceae bacterium]|nr:DUF3467 domain-containing protein [Bacteroidaceae bacterium]